MSKISRSLFHMSSFVTHTSAGCGGSGAGAPRSWQKLKPAILRSHSQEPFLCVLLMKKWLCILMLIEIWVIDKCPFIDLFGSILNFDLGIPPILNLTYLTLLWRICDAFAPLPLASGSISGSFFRILKKAQTAQQRQHRGSEIIKKPNMKIQRPVKKSVEMSRWALQERFFRRNHEKSY